MKHKASQSGIDVFIQLKTRLQERRLKLESLNAYRPHATDELRGIINGHRKPTLGNVSWIAEAVWGLVQTPEKSLEPKESVAAFWQDFCLDLHRRVPMALPPVLDEVLLKTALRSACALGETSSVSRSPGDAPVNPFTWRWASGIRSPDPSRIGGLSWST